MSDHYTGDDPINDLSRFGDDFSTGTGGAMPLPAAAVRRRGDQIRRRRTALVAGASALAVAAVTVPIFAIVGGDPKADSNNDIADDNKTSQSLSAEDLLRDADTEYSPTDETPWRTSETFEGDGQALYNPCQKQALSDLGATNSFTRAFTWGDTEPLGGTGLVEQIAEFDSPADARSAYDTFAQWIIDCEITDADRTNVVPEGRAVALPSGDAVIYDLNWSLEPESEDPFGDSSYISETGLVLQDDRIAVIAVTINGQDYNFLDEEGGTPVKRMIPKAAERLRPGTGQPAAPETTETVEPPETTGTPGPGASGSSGAVNPAIYDAFPLTLGLPDDSEAEPGEEGIVGPARDIDRLPLEACDVALPDAPHADQLMAGWQNIEDYRTRQLTTYSSVDQAIAAADEIRALYAGCPSDETRADGYTPFWQVRDTNVGGQSFVVFGWDEFEGAPTTFGETLLVVRVGISVLVVAHSGHGGNPQGREQEVIDQITTESADVIGELCVFTEARC
ncbi:hypothetical protein [Nocardioides sp. WS12]|uniref:hypothetical protein n=1 Tax=Nocardioides sp. WS12 TaxID=2486272 RepID=UPI0015FE6857|nr:hypothetical protein [Nocardioides sp. WS12]